MSEEYIPQTIPPSGTPERSVQSVEGDPLPPQPISDGEFFNIMDTEINSEVSFPEDMMSGLREKFMKMKDDYAKGDKDTQALLEADVVQTGERIQKPEQFKVDLASKCMSGSGIGHSPTKKLAEYTNDIVNIVNGTTKATYDKNTPGYEMHDGWKSMDDIGKLVTSRYVDETSKNMLNTMITDQQKLASNIQPGENAEFNWQKAHNNIRTKLVESGDMKSLATDKIFGNRVFEDDLMSAIENGTYQELGLSEEVINSMDPTPDGKISSEDAAAITSGVLQDNDMLKDYLTDYYVKAMEQNFYDSLSPDVRKATQWKNQHNPPIKETSSNNIKVKGGIVKNGIFMPNK